MLILVAVTLFFFALLAIFFTFPKQEALTIAMLLLGVVFFSFLFKQRVRQPKDALAYTLGSYTVKNRLPLND